MSSPHFVTFLSSIPNFPPSLFDFPSFLLHFPFFLTSLFLVGQQKFPGQKSLGALCSLPPPPTCYPTDRRNQRSEKGELGLFLTTV